MNNKLFFILGFNKARRRWFFHN